VSEPATAPASFQRLLIVRLGAMGDIIHTLPAVAALRAAFPDCKLGWIVEERWAELLCTLTASRSGPLSPERPLVSNIHTVNTKEWRHSMASPQTWKQIGAAAREVRSEQYEVAIDFQGAIRSALIARLAHPNIIYGFGQPREIPARRFYTDPVTARGTHIVEQNLSLAEEVAGRALPTPPAIFPRDEAAEQECNRRLDNPPVGRFALLNPGAGWGAKRWPAERYGRVARELATDGLKPFINFGPAEEDLARSVREASKGAAEIIKCSITQLIALTRHASLFIGGDTGPMHLAAALNIPVVAIFGPTDPARNGPFGTTSTVLRSPASQTSHKRRSRPDEGLLDITEHQVLAAGRQLLENSRG
jgi:heptosyltransferase I